MTKRELLGAMYSELVERLREYQQECANLALVRGRVRASHVTIAAIRRELERVERPAGRG
jgi:hypothetical protein